MTLYFLIYVRVKIIYAYTRLGSFIYARVFTLE